MKRTTPFKAEAEFEEELIKFANQHKTVMSHHANRISDFFEMSCYNLIAKYYENIGYTLEVQNLIKGAFRYKCSPTGKIENFSYFKGMKDKGDGTEDIFYLYHNVPIQSAQDDEIFTTPDIVITRTNTPQTKDNYYDSKLTLSYLSKENLITFCEAKHLVPFPELIFNFIGVVNELTPQCLLNKASTNDCEHIAPSLMMSGVMNKPTKRIKQSLEKRYFVNVFDDLLDNLALQIFAKHNKHMITTLATKGENDDLEMSFENYS